VSGLVRRGLVFVGICSSRSAYCRGLFGEVFLESGRVRVCRFSVGVFLGKVGDLSLRVRRGRISVGTCSTRTGNCLYVFGEVGFVSGLVQ